MQRELINKKLRGIIYLSSPLGALLPVVALLTMVACERGEECDWKDNDKDGIIDEGFDEDGDGYWLCGQTEALFTEGQFDCADDDDAINPNQSELCDLVDNNCDGRVDEGCGEVLYSTSDTLIQLLPLNSDLIYSELLLLSNSESQSHLVTFKSIESDSTEFVHHDLDPSIDALDMVMLSINDDDIPDIVLLESFWMIPMVGNEDDGYDYALDLIIEDEYYYTNQIGRVIDLDGNGQLDIVILGSVGVEDVALSVIYQFDGELRHELLLEVLGVPSSLSGFDIVDMDGQGSTGFVFTAGSELQWVTEKEGGFEVAGSISLPEKPAALSTADLNGDDLVDVVVTIPMAWKVLVFLNNGHGFDEPGFELASYRHPEGLVLEDFDVDGDIDIVVSSQDEGALKFYSNNGVAHFTTLCEMPTGSDASLLVPVKDSDTSWTLALGNRDLGSLLLMDNLCDL